MLKAQVQTLGLQGIQFAITHRRNPLFDRYTEHLALLIHAS
jgi:hypothetical protein